MTIPKLNIHSGYTLEQILNKDTIVVELVQMAPVESLKFNSFSS